MSTLKERIRELRGQRTQEEAAARCGMSQPSWSKLERGRGETGFLGDVADAYGVSFQWLKNGRGPKFAARPQVADLMPVTAGARLRAAIERGSLDASDIEILAHFAELLESIRKRLPLL